MMIYDYGIIGGGPAGYTCAINLAQKGFNVILFEKKQLGGTCLNQGCIPTKSLLHSSEFFKQLNKGCEFGIEIEIKSFDFSKIAEKKDKTVEKIRKNLEIAVKNSGVHIVYAEATPIDNNTIKADNEYKVKEIIIATGSKPKETKDLKLDGKFILSSDDVLNLQMLPKSVVIIGSGAIGTEWARIFSNFGVDVTIVEMAEHLIPLADIDISKRIERIFKQNKIKFYLNDSVDKIENNVVYLKSGNLLEPDFVLLAIGRTPINADIKTFNTIGDACGGIQLAHSAITQAIKLANKNDITLDKNFIPSVIYGDPEIAWVGLREQDCNDDIQKVMLPITALGKSWCDDATDGFIKIIAKSNYIVGAHIVSKEASALIHQILIAMQNNIPVEKLKEICFAHPTFSEGFFEAISRL